MIDIIRFDCGKCSESYKFTNDGHITGYEIHKAAIGDFVVIKDDEVLIWEDIKECTAYVDKLLEADNEYMESINVSQNLC